jgi:response regulator RpfG family c-di-GMP phosphodiesterase/signal transduction histidine kinase
MTASSQGDSPRLLRRTESMSSYRQTIFAYPSGSGSYIVSRENLGRYPSLVAAASPAAAISAMTDPTFAVSPSAAWIRDSVPAAGDGISLSTLSVDTSTSGSSTAAAGEVTRRGHPAGPPWSRGARYGHSDGFREGGGANVPDRLGIRAWSQWCIRPSMHHRALSILCDMGTQATEAVWAATWAKDATAPTVLVVDDDDAVRRLMLRILEGGGYHTDQAADARQARQRLECFPYDAILIDARMPGESGIDLLRHVRLTHPDIAPVMVTALEDQELVETAFEVGAYAYVVKPFRTRDLLINVTNALHRRRREMHNRNHIQELEATAAERGRRLQEAIVPLPDPDLVAVSAEEVIAELSRVVTVRDEETGEHILRMSNYAALLAERSGLAGSHTKRIRLASALHDVGKIGIPDAILLKPGPLTPDEYRVMQTHTLIGHQLLDGSTSPLLRLGATIAISHHERWDGIPERPRRDRHPGRRPCGSGRGRLRRPHLRPLLPPGLHPRAGNRHDEGGPCNPVRPGVAGPVPRVDGRCPGPPGAQPGPPAMSALRVLPDHGTRKPGGRLLGLHHWTALFLAAALAVSGALSLLTVGVIHNSEASFLKDQTLIYSDVFSAFVGQISSVLGEAAATAGPTGASFAAVQGNPLYQEFTTLALITKTGTTLTLTAVSGTVHAPLTDPSSTAAQRIEGMSQGAFTVLGFSGSGAAKAFDLAARPYGSPFIVYAEVNPGTAIGPSSGPGNLDYAVYIGGSEQPADLAIATTSKLPLRSGRVVAVLTLKELASGGAPSVLFGTKPGQVQGGPTDFLLVASPKGKPLGWLAGNLFWIFLVSGILASVLLAGALELLLRRRDQGLALVADLEANNAALDQALADEAQSERERGRLEERLRQAQRLEAVGQLAGGIAHDFNNLLAVILGNGDFALEALEGHPAHADIEEMVQAAQRAADLTRQLLIFSRKDIVRPVAVDLNKVVRSTTRLLERTLGEHIELHSTLAENLPMVEADVTGLEQVLMNLAVNARDAMPEGGVLSIATEAVDLSETFTATLPDLSPGSYIELSVADTGCGMAPEVQTHIFEPFFTTKPVGQGTGMGLATIYAIVTRWGGHITVYSEPDLGTTFKVWLPVMVDASHPAKAAPAPARHGERQVVLLVEDEEAVRRTTRRVLDRGGYEVREASDGPTALATFRQAAPGTFDLLITDVIMPGGMSGKALSDEIKGLAPELPVLYMSGYTADVIATRGVLDPDVTLIEKPFTADALLMAVGNALGARHNV